MMALGVLLTIIFILDALRLRGRLSAFKTLDTSSQNVRDEHVLLSVEGYSIPLDVEVQAKAYAQKMELDVLDLIPGHWHSLGILSVGQMLDAKVYRSDRLGKGRSAGVACLVRRSVAERAQIPATPRPLSPADLTRIVSRLKLYACTTTDAVVCPTLAVKKYDLSRRRGVLSHVIGGMAVPILLGQIIIVTALMTFAVHSPLWGGLALLSFHLQPLLAMLGAPFRCRDLPLQIFARSPWEVWVSFMSLFGSREEPAKDDPLPALRKKYEADVSSGLDPLFEERRDTCPLCGSDRLFNRIKTTDLVQRKPGVFHLDECPSCGHIFQNPRLSIEGLNYYYGDFYDGLGEAGLEAVFGHSAEPYLKRARMIEGHGDPKKWLDVGAGHGHFCCVARDVWPECTFDALDLSESVEEAVRRGWADHGHRGLFPEMAQTIEGQYDVISMSHYLEHTREPKDELEAAHLSLREDGLLFIEIPDPDCILGRVLGRWWVPWFQPQHQHLLNTSNVEDLLDLKGFDILDWHHGQAHQEVDFLFATYLQVNRLAPPKGVPWAPPLGAVGTMLHSFVWILGTPWIAMGWLTDRIMASPMSKSQHSNTLRVLARKRNNPSD